MANNKLTKEELQSLQDIRNNNAAVIQEFGNIAITQLDVDKRKASAENFLNNLRTSEAELAKKLEEKYGRGNINLETGEFISDEPIATGAESVDLPEIEEPVEVKEDAKKGNK